MGEEQERPGEEQGTRRGGKIRRDWVDNQFTTRPTSGWWVGGGGQRHLSIYTGVTKDAPWSLTFSDIFTPLLRGVKTPN